MGILQILPEISNTQQQPLIYLPLFVIVVISMLKDYMEDYKRKKSDREENNRKVQAFSHENEFADLCWKDLQIGQIIKARFLNSFFGIYRKKKICRDEFLPADIILLNTSELQGVCYIETKNLDGETNLKQKSAHKDLINLFKDEKSFQVCKKFMYFL